MLVIGDLSIAIKNKVNELTPSQKVDSLAVHSAYADAIVEYLTANLEIHGTYTGTIGPNPDPLNGPYVWDVNDMELTGQNIMTGAQGSFNGWKNAIQTGIRSIEALGEDNGAIPAITTSVIAYLNLYVLAFTQADMNKVNNFDAATEILATKVINAFVGVLPDPISVAATSTGGGSGVVVFTLIQ